MRVRSPERLASERAEKRTNTEARERKRKRGAGVWRDSTAEKVCDVWRLRRVWLEVIDGDGTGIWNE